ncbi:MAG: M28 family peptidase [Candidatus Symbiothrix sp.]|jgi:hypothetical protein|nr:M28 family peptidase [Candidatus Symbiothrix sp.]
MKKIFLFLFLFLSLGCFAQQSDTLLIKNHLSVLTKTDGFRNYQNLKVLNQTADFIASIFRQYADTVYFQEFKVEKNIYKNVICRFGTKINKPLVVIGAHYDVCGNQQGADDNASGVVALLELARMLKNAKTSYPVELVAFTLEEPPFFRSQYMGSYIHANYLKNNNIPLYGMVAVEMIGYFDDQKQSQSYPVKTMKVAYGTKGDFILLAKKTGSGEFVKQFSKQFKNAETIETESFKIPSKIRSTAGIDFSDHLNYWNLGYDALMVTNTSFYRNKNYHQKTDTMETLDIPRMAKVIDGIVQAIILLK